MSFTERTDEIEYSTDECIKDRLQTIKNQSEEDYKYVVANILTAKAFMKRIGAYKKEDGPAPEEEEKDTRGGFGAVGIENWILQNGGSFEKAARDFMSVAQNFENLQDFQKHYDIWDFGENHIATEKGFYPHDNFVFNLSEDGYKKIKEALGLELERMDHKAQDKVSIEDIVNQDTSVLFDKPYMDAINYVLNKGKNLENEHD